MLSLPRLRGGYALALTAGLLLTLPAAAHAGTQTFPPVGDTYSRADAPSTNYGGQDRFSQAASPLRRSYLRFDVRLPQGSTVTRASLRLGAFSSADPAGVELRGVGDTSWTEGGLTHANAPVPGPVVARAGSYARGATVALDAAPLVRGSGLVSMSMTTTGGYSAFDSRESAKQPQLVVEYAEASGDTAPPDTTITSGPAQDSTTSSSSASFGFQSSEAGSTYECRLDAAAFAPCASPASYTGLSNGPHSFEVRATDAAGNIDPTPARRSWTVGAAPPAQFAPDADAYAETGLAKNFGGSASLMADLEPARETYVRFPVSGLSGTVRKATLRLYSTDATTDGPKLYATSPTWSESQIQGGIGRPARTSGVLDDKASVASGQYVDYDVTSQVARDGTYSFALAGDSRDGWRANSREAAANPPRLIVESDGGAAAPETTIDSGPSGTVRSASASFTFSSSSAGSTFECRIDTASYAACSTPKSYSALSEGQHTFEVRAKDSAGTVDPTRAARTFVVDTTPPTVTGANPASGGTSVPASANVTADFSEAIDPATLGAASFTLRKQGATADIQAPVAYDAAGRRATLDPSAALEPATAYTATVRGGTSGVRDSAGNPLAADRAWTFTTSAAPTDTTAPTVSISRPSSGATYTTAQTVNIDATTSSDTVKVEFYDNGVYQGSEDTAPFGYTWSVTAADNGAHSWTAKAYDAAGNSATSSPVTSTVAITDGGGPSAGTITPSAETAPVPHTGDAADDPAVWIHPTDPAKSTIIGTDKQGQLDVYDLAGNRLHAYTDSKPNNVDLRYNFELGGQRRALVATSDNSTEKNMRLYTVDPATRGLDHVSARVIPTGVAAGLCMYRSSKSGKSYAFIGDNSGTVQQWELFASTTSPGKVDATKVRTIRLGSTTEGCVADDETGKVYISEEDQAIWAYGAEPGDGAATTDRTKVDGLTTAGGRLTNDIEGLAIYRGTNGSGYLLASSQGSNDYVVYDRKAPHAYKGRFRVGDGTQADGSSYTDGLDVTNAPLGSGFPEGAFIAQDDRNTTPAAGNQNFKLVPWGRIARGMSPALSVDTSHDPRTVGAPSTTSPTPTEPSGDDGTTAGATYYVDPAGSDSAAGTTEASAWRTLDRATSADLSPGDRLLLKRGATFSGQLEVTESGTSADRLTVGAFGEGSKPRITGASDCVELGGSFVTVQDLHLDACGYAGARVTGDQNTVKDSLLSNNIAGAYVRFEAKGTRILDSVIRDNNKMSDAACGGPGDSGAFGVLLHGEDTEIARNTISGSDAASCEYGRDGAAIEIYRGRESNIHHNVGVDNHHFSELGESDATNNTFAYNVVRSNLGGDSKFLVTRGAENPDRGPVLGTKAYNNTVRLTGSGSEGFVCGSGCSSLVLRLRNNVIQAVEKAGYADAPFDEDHNLYFGGAPQFTLGSKSFEEDPDFVGPPDNLRLQSSSPGIDAGTAIPGQSTDHDGRSVPADGDGDGSSATDMGAFEYR